MQQSQLGMQSLYQTDFNFDCHFTRQRGKVRDVYVIEESFIVLVATDRISAFDVQFQEAIPWKGQVLNELAVRAFDHTEQWVKNHLLSTPDEQVMICQKAEPYKIEVVVRGHLCGHAWREYAAGKRSISGVELPEGLRENDPLPEPILTPTTKSQFGHDLDITEEEIVKSQLVPGDEYMLIKNYALKLFEEGQQQARASGLILADTKYEFGNKDFDVILIDEIHTPDSSRYFYAEGFEERQERGEPQPQLSKEHLRKWLMAQGYSGQADATPPALTPEMVQELSQRYLEVYERMAGEPMIRRSYENIHQTMENRIREKFAKIGLKL